MAFVIIILVLGIGITPTRGVAFVTPGVITILIAGFTNIFNIAFVFLLHFLSYIV